MNYSTSRPTGHGSSSDNANQERSDSQSYKAKKNRFNNMLTIYGRKPVLEALQDSSIPVFAIHLADSNKNAAIINQIQQLAEQRGIATQFMDKRALSRISRNSKQDQGVAADLALPGYQQLENFLADYQADQRDRLLAVDGVSNPQNLGMIIRSAAASGIRALVIPEQGSAAMGPLVIKASAGAIFKCPIIRCQQLCDAIDQFKARDISIASLAMQSSSTVGGLPQLSFYELSQQAPRATVFVLGNETEGVSQQTLQQSDFNVYIPMHNEVESLNVAVTAALIAYATESTHV